MCGNTFKITEITLTKGYDSMTYPYLQDLKNCHIALFNLNFSQTSQAFPLAFFWNLLNK